MIIKFESIQIYSLRNRCTIIEISGRNGILAGAASGHVKKKKCPRQRRLFNVVSGDFPASYQV